MTVEEMARAFMRAQNVRKSYRDQIARSSTRGVQRYEERVLATMQILLPRLEQRPPRTALEVAHWLHSSFLAYCMEVQAPLPRDEWRAWEAEPDWSLAQMKIGGRAILRLWRKEHEEGAA